MGVFLLAGFAEGTEGGEGAHQSDCRVSWPLFLILGVSGGHRRDIPISSLSIPVFADMSLAEMLCPPVGIAWKTPASSRVRRAPMLAIYFRQCLSRIQGAGQGMYVLKIGKEHIDGATDGLQQARGLDHQIVAGTVIIVGSLVCLGGIDNLVQSLWMASILFPMLPIMTYASSIPVLSAELVTSHLRPPGAAVLLIIWTRISGDSGFTSPSANHYRCSRP